MKKIFKYFFLFLISLLGLILIAPEDREWVKCSDEKDLYRYVYNNWKVDKVLKYGDITHSDTGQKLYYKGIDPQIYLKKTNKIKILNYGWRCWFEQGAENNITN